MTYVEYAGNKRVREPLGGREAEGFDAWLTDTVRQTHESREALRSEPLNNPVRYMSVEAERQYGCVLAEWRDVKAGRRTSVVSELARDRFEKGLIGQVMASYGAWQFARERGYGPNDWTAGGRPMMDVSGEYVRRCKVLAAYVGVDEVTVSACRDDQDALTALRNTRA